MVEKADIDIRHLVTVDDVMEKYELGPNGALIYAMDFLWDNKEWLQDQMVALQDDTAYFVFDMPGQVELYTENDSAV